MTILSATDQAYMSHAAAEATKSDLQSRHGCIAVINGRIMGRGHNSSRTYSCDGFIHNTCSCHAEMAALRNVWHSSGSNSYGKYNRQIKVGREE